MAIEKKSLISKSKTPSVKSTKTATTPPAKLQTATALRVGKQAQLAKTYLAKTYLAKRPTF